MESRLRQVIATGVAVIALGIQPWAAAAQVTVTPDGQSSGTVDKNETGLTASFTVNPYAWAELDCWVTGALQSCSVQSFTSESGAHTIDVTFSSSSSTGTGYVWLEAMTTDPPECFFSCDTIYDTGSRIYTVNAPPTAAFDYSPSTPTEDITSVAFTNNSTDDSGVTGCDWDFGDGGSSTSCAGTVYHTYTSSGQKTVELIVTDASSAADTVEHTVTVNHRPTASFNYSPTSPNVSESVGFNAGASSDPSPGSISSYAWTFAGGSPSTGTGQTPSSSFGSNGSHTVTLIVTDNNGGADTTSTNVSVNAYPSASFSPSTTTPNVGASVSFTNTSSDSEGISSYAWDFASGASPGTSTAQHPSTTYGTGGSKDVRLIVTDTNGAKDTTVVQLDVNAPPVAAFDPDPDSTGVNDPVSFTNQSTDDNNDIVSWDWNFDDGKSSTAQSPPNQSYSSAGVKTIELIVVDGGGLADTVSHTVGIEANNPPVAKYNRSITYPLVDESITFTSTSTDSDGTIEAYDWDFDDGGGATVSAPSHSFTSAGQYSVQLTVDDDDAAQDDTTMVVEVLQPLTVSLADANPGSELARYDCVNISVGAASVVCDDFQYVYGFTPLNVMNRQRQLALVYNRSTSGPEALVGVNVTIPSGQAEPDQICVNLALGGADETTCYDDALYEAGDTRRFTIEADYSTPEGLSLIHDTVTVTTYDGVTPMREFTDTGVYVGVDNRTVFSRGWWLASYERLVPPAGSSLVWMGGDQSYRIYEEVSTDVFVAETRTRPDTITVSGGEYTRHLIGGGHVYFDASGNHTRTVDRSGNTTLFSDSTFTDNVTRPTEIRFTTPVAADTVTGYKLVYAENGALDSVLVRNQAGSGFDAFVVGTDTTNAAGHLMASITTPDGLTTSFSQPSGVMEHIIGPGGLDTLSVEYEHLKVTEITHSASGVTDVVYTFEPASVVGTSTSAGWDAPEKADSVRTLLDGPRTDSADVTLFFTTGWGAAHGVEDAHGNQTWIDYTNDSFPALPTRVEYPNGRVVLASYYTNGLLQEVTDSLRDAVTKYEWDTKWSRPTKIISPDSVVTELSYDGTTGDRDWQRVHQDTVHFDYDSFGRVVSITDPEDNETTFAYDSILGNLSTETAPTSIGSSIGSSTAYTRDGRGTAVVIVSTSGDTTSVRDTIHIDVMGRQTLTARTVLNDTTDLMWLETVHEYDTLTGRKTRTFARGGTEPSDTTTSTMGDTRWVYDNLGRVIVEDQPATLDTLVYDPAGNVVERIRVNGTEAFTDTMFYDARNLLVRREIPDRTVSLDSINGVPFPYYESEQLDIDGTDVTIHGDTLTFAYDEMGQLTEADNRFARIRRTYYPWGGLATDTLRIRNYNSDTTFTTHVYGVGHDYSLDGKRTVIHHPAWLVTGSDSTTTYTYDANTGRLSGITDAEGEDYGFTYNGNGQPTVIDHPAGLDTLAYDALGRVIDRDGITITRDPSGRIVSVSEGSTFEYNGFGHLTESQIDRTLIQVLERFERDAFGEATHHHSWPQSQTPTTHPGTAMINQTNNTSGAMVSALEHWKWGVHEDSAADWTPGWTSYGVDGRGNRTSMMELRYEWELEGPVYDPWAEVRKEATHEHQARSYYTAHDQMVVHQITRDSTYHDEASGQDQDGPPWGAYEEYWYDALGRRIVKVSRQSSPLCTYTARCYSSIERYVWDGDQILWELRDQGTSDSANPTNGTYTGEIGYIHAGAIDQPIGMIRNGSTIGLELSWRGTFDDAVDTDAQVTFTDVPFPGGSWKATGVPLDPRENHTWVGSLVMGQADHSGLQYRRNRYYDPATGQFTQPRQG